MEINITTPALLFPAISLILLAFTNRFLTLANLIRQLHATYKTEPDENIRGQIANLRYRINLIRDMQAFGVSSLFLVVISMLTLFLGYSTVGKWVFAGSLLFMAISLGYSLREIQVSVVALNLKKKDIEDYEDEVDRSAAEKIYNQGLQEKTGFAEFDALFGQDTQALEPLADDKKKVG